MKMKKYGKFQSGSFGKKTYKLLCQEVRYKEKKIKTLKKKA